MFYKYMNMYARSYYAKSSSRMWKNKKYSTNRAHARLSIYRRNKNFLKNSIQNCHSLLRPAAAVFTKNFSRPVTWNIKEMWRRQQKILVDIYMVHGDYALE